MDKVKEVTPWRESIRATRYRPRKRLYTWARADWDKTCCLRKIRLKLLSITGRQSIRINLAVERAGQLVVDKNSAIVGPKLGWESRFFAVSAWGNYPYHMRRQLAIDIDTALIWLRDQRKELRALRMKRMSRPNVRRIWFSDKLSPPQDCLKEMLKRLASHDQDCYKECKRSIVKKNAKEDDKPWQRLSQRMPKKSSSHNEDYRQKCKRRRPAMPKIVTKNAKEDDQLWLKIVTKNVKENDKPWLKIVTKNAKEDDQP